MSKFIEEIAGAVKKSLATPVKQPSDMFGLKISKKVGSAYDGGTTNAHGDYTGTGMPYTLFNVTGDVIIKAIYGIVNTTLTGATSTIEVGVTGNTAVLIAQETCTDLADGDVYNGASSAVGCALLADGGAFWAINDGLDIIETLGTANVTAGQIDWYVLYYPMEEGASVISATD